MPRKSFILRLSQAQELLAEWKLQSREDDKRALFVRDMIFRMGKRKQLSSKQKAYLDSLIEQGVPENRVVAGSSLRSSKNPSNITTHDDGDILILLSLSLESCIEILNNINLKEILNN